MDEHDLWVSSGAHELTGRPDGPPASGPGAPASAVQRGLDRIAAAHPRARLPGVELLSERARLAGLTRRGPWSCGGAFRVLTTRDGHVGLSLARGSDLDLVPALVRERDVTPERAWATAATWAAATSTAIVAERVALLGLAGGAVPERPPARAAVVTQALGRRARSGRPLVVDLTSLWAGPLCARLLGLAGARVVKVESRTRPDGTRAGPPAFFEAMHRDHEQLALDLPGDVATLRDLMAEADLVLESSRPRALRQLGLHAEEVVEAGTSWLSITARGRDTETIGYGDDVAAAAGHVVRDGEDLLPVGDALADPLAGVAAAAAAVEALDREEAHLIDVSMLHTAIEAMTP